MSLRYRTTSLIGWLGSIVMLAASVITVIPAGQSFIALVQIGFAIGALLFITGLYYKIGQTAASRTSQPGEVQSRTINDILEVAASRESLIELLNYSLDRFLEVFTLNSGAIHILHGAKDVLVMGAYRGLIPSHANRLELIKPGDTAIGRAVQNKRVLIIRDLRVSPDYNFFGGKAEGYSFLAVSPIMVEDKCWGVITLMGRKKYQRGVLDVNQLEQFGIKLGQALVVGRENRKMQSAYNLLKDKLEFYNNLFDKVRNNLTNLPELDDKAVFQTLKNYPAQLFGGRSFCVLKFVSGRGRCVYLHDQSGSDQYPAVNLDKSTLLSNLPSGFKAGYCFDIEQAELTGLIPTNLFGNGKRAGYGYSFGVGRDGLVVVDISEISKLESYREDIALIGDLLTLTQISLIPKTSKPEISKPADGVNDEITQDLSTIFAGISGNVQLMFDQLGHDGDSINQSDYMRWLNSVEEAALKGIGILNKIGTRNNPNIIIQSVLDSENLNVAFYPGSRIPQVGSDPDEFEKTIKTILTEAIADNRLIRLKSTPRNNKVALTIEGSVKQGFPSRDLVGLARTHNIELDVIPRDHRPILEIEQLSGDELKTPDLKALTIENKPVITDLLQDFFKQIGYSNHIVATGGDGLAYLESAIGKNERIDVAVIDMTLDDISGLELCRKIKEIKPDIYTVIISSWGVNLYKNTLDDAGVDAILHKPFRLEQLKNALPKRKLKDAPENK